VASVSAANKTSEVRFVPAYITCPYCQHPTVLPTELRGKLYRCRQCSDIFIVKCDPSALRKPKPAHASAPGARKPL